MTDKGKVFRDLRTEQLARRTRLVANTRGEILRLLDAAGERVRLYLAAQPSDAVRWVLADLQAEIRQMMAEFGDQAAARASSTATDAWQAGQDLVDLPLEGVGYRIAGVTPLLDTGQLMAMRAFLTDRIKDVGLQAANRINTELGLTVLGAQAPTDAITRVADILKTTSRVRAITIVRTELMRSYDTAAQARLVQVGGGDNPIVPGLKKQWRRSGKTHSRLDHDLADGQVREIDKPFLVGGVKLMYPHDPAAPAEHTINCGCTMLPWIEGWEVAAPGRRRFTAEEMRANPMKRDIQDALDAGRSLRDLAPGGKAA